MHTATTSSAPYTPLSATPGAASTTMQDEELLGKLSFCCCSLVDNTLGLHQHLDTCELHNLLQVNGGDNAFHFSLDETMSHDDRSDTSSTSPTTTADASAKRRRHRDSMARLRQKMRTSIAGLQVEEQQLERVLRRTLATFRSNTSTSTIQVDATAVDPRVQLQRAFYELVNEQLKIQDERKSLEVTQAQQDKYARLVQRELDRVARGGAQDGGEEPSGTSE